MPTNVNNNQPKVVQVDVRKLNSYNDTNRNPEAEVNEIQNLQSQNELIEKQIKLTETEIKQRSKLSDIDAQHTKLINEQTKIMSKLERNISLTLDERIALKIKLGSLIKDEAEILQERANIAGENLDNEKELTRLEQQRIKNMAEVEKMTEAINKANERGATLSQKIAKKKQDAANKDKKLKEEELRYLQELAKAAKDSEGSDDWDSIKADITSKHEANKDKINKSGNMSVLEKILGAIVDENGTNTLLKQTNQSLINFGKRIEGSINSGVDAYSNYLGKVDSRLQSSTGILNGGFKSIVKNMTMTYGSSPFVKQAEYLSKLVELVDKGVTSNLEERATIMALGDNLLNSFNATSQSLLRLVRIQGTDLTASSLGSQALLTKFLNTNYGDSSYISDMYQSVDDILLDAAALMSPDEATSFRYEVQKWLGSLYSRGASGQAITSLAQGLVALSTGNNSQLSSNQGLRTLLLSSATSAGLDYGSLMHSGLDSSTVGLLMNALINNVGDIYSNSSSSRILGTSYGNVYGLNLADIRAISNLNPASILNSSTTNYQTSYNEYLNQVGQLGNRSTASTRARNFLDNLVYTGGLNIAGSDFDYWAYTIVNMLSNTLSGDAKGYAELAKMGMLLGSSVSLTPENMLTTLLTGDWQGLLSGTVTVGKNWDAVIDPTGYAFSLPGASNTTGISGSISVGNAGESRFLNLQDNALAVSATTQNVLGSKNIVARDINDLYAALFEEQSTPIRVKLASFEEEAINALTSTSGYFPVDVRDEDIGSINDAVSRLQLVRNDFYYYGDQSR